jgi:uncharacterized lipoprotein NlpE involved in copper resistance
MKKYIISVLAIVLVAALSGCSNASQAKINAWSKSHKVSLYSGGIQVGQWVTTGKVENEQQSDGFYFQDSVNGKVIRISGDVIIEVLN